MADEDPTEVDDRREHPRLSAKIDIRFRAAAEAERALKAYSVNLSMGGLCLKTQRAYEVGEKLSLNITVEKEDFELIGVVAWSRNGAIGVRFVDMTAANVTRLEQIFRKLKA